MIYVDDSLKYGIVYDWSWITIYRGDKPVIFTSDAVIIGKVIQLIEVEWRTYASMT